MDIDGILDDSTISDDTLVITPAIRDFLSQSARWGKFVSIVGLVGMGLMIITILLGGSSILMMLAGGNFPFGPGGGTLFILIYLAIISIFILPLIYLYNFSTKVQIAIRDDNQTLLTDAFKNHKSLFKFYGVFTAIVLGFYALLLILSLLGGLGAALAS